MPFNKVLLGVGGVLVAGVAFHLFFRGPEVFPVSPAWEVRHGDSVRGKELIERYGCGACHVIPGITRARGRVGPQLKELRDQIYLAGILPNTPENLVAWIQNPQRFEPGTAMPNLGVNEQEARDMAAYLLQFSSGNPGRALVASADLTRWVAW